MFRTIRLLPKLIRFTQVATCLALIYNQQQNFRCSQINTQTIKTINEQDVNAILANPQNFSNTIIILNKNIIDDLPKHLSIQMQIFDGTFNDYDLIAINNHRCLLLKIKGEEDYLKLLNFLTPLRILNNKQDAIDLIDQMDAKIYLSYIPQQTIVNSEEQINKIQTTKEQHNKIDPQQLEEQFRELRYIDYNREAQYYIIKDKNIAEEFKLSFNDIGKVYVLKQTSIFNAKESSFQHNSKEYFMNEIELDLNIQTQDNFTIKNKYESLSSYIKGYQQSTVQQLNLQKFVQKLTLTSNNYVNYVFNKQQMDSQLLIYKQMGVKYILIYHCQNDMNEKIIKKLISVKKSMNIQQQQQLAIIYSDNLNLIQTYFGLVSNGFIDDIRLIDLNSHQTSTTSFNIVQQISFEKYYDQYRQCKRYSFGDKVTVNRLKQFIVQTTNFQIQNIQPSNNFREEYYEKTFVKVPLEKLQTITANSFNLTGFDFIYFYKPGCAACHTVAETLEKIADSISNPNPYRVRNISNFKKISFKKYNIFNESILLPSPIQAPLIYVIYDGKIKKADLVQNKINPGDESKMLHFLTKFIDNL